MIGYYGINMLLTEMRENRQIVKNKLRNLPDGILLVSKEKKRTNYFKVTFEDGKRIRKSIGSNFGLVYKLANKAFLEEQLKRIDIEISLLDNAVKRCKGLDNQAILNGLPRNFALLKPEYVINPAAWKSDAMIPHPVSEKSIKPIILKESITEMVSANFERSKWRWLTDEKWFTMPYMENTSFPEHKTIIANNGLRTRSKSEALIIGLYEEKNIYYHYDETVIVNGVLLSPDILGLKRNGNFFIHEHAGLWSEEYMQRNQYKIEQYRKAGFVLGKNLILSFDDENGNINLRLISEMIDDMYTR